eukprot:2037244-Prymnesium_polylepis.1
MHPADTHGCRSRYHLPLSRHHRPLFLARAAAITTGHSQAGPERPLPRAAPAAASSARCR